MNSSNAFRWTGHEMRLVVFLNALMAVLAAGVNAQDAVWRDDASGPAMTRRGGDRPRLLYFTASWCSPCRLVEREVFDHPDGQRMLARFDLFRFHLDHATNQSIADSLGVTTVPTFVVLDSLGREIDRVRGYRSRRLLLRDLERIVKDRGTQADLERRLSARPGDPGLQAALGLRRYERLELDAAERLLAAGLSQPSALDDTVAGEAARALAEVHRLQGDPAAGKRVLTEFLDRRADHLYPRATWMLLATCCADAGLEYEEAGALRGAARLAPPRTGALVAFASAAARLSWSLIEAEAAARQAVAMTDRQDPEPQAVLAAVLRRRRNYPEAMLWIKRAVATAPDEPRWGEQRDVIWRAAIAGD